MRENKTPAMMTIVKPTTSAEATLTDLDAFNIATGLSVSTNDIKYYKATKNGDEYTKGEALTVAPTAAGDYVAEITVSGVKNRDDEPNQSVTASVGYTIATPEGINYGDDNYIKPDDTVAVSNSDEGKTKFGLNLGEYFNMQMLGIQKKSAIATEGGEDGIRFVTAVNTNLLKGNKIEDYGYIVVKSQQTDINFIYNNMSKLTYDKVGANNRFTCKGTSNTISGDFGKFDTDTDYKYVTLALTGTSGSSDTVAARFYVKTTDGNFYYADYVKGNDTHSGMAFKLSDVIDNLG